MPNHRNINAVKMPEKQDANELLASFIAAGDLSAVDDYSWLSAVRQIADTVVVGWAGSSEDGAYQAADLALLEETASVSRLWGRAESVSVSQAVFVNAVSAAALDYDRR